jgi:hypothetical protein
MLFSNGYFEVRSTWKGVAGRIGQQPSNVASRFHQTT